MDQISYIERFKAGEEFSYPVIYLGKGLVEDIIPNHILTKGMQIPGRLYFSLEGVDFRIPKPVNYTMDSDFVFNTEFSYPLYECLYILK